MSPILSEIAAKHVNWTEVIPLGIACAIVILILQSFINNCKQ